MEVIEQIKKSRIILKDCLKEEYDTDSLPIYSIDEIDKLFDLESTKENPYYALGKGNACNFTLDHKFIKNHKLHVLYYNFQRESKTKVTKSIIDRIMPLYTDDVFQTTDNVLLILNEPIKETIISLNNELNLRLKQNPDKIENDIGYENKHFRNIFMFYIAQLQFNILNHELVPKHEIIRNQKDIDNILENCNCSIDQLPIISKNDPVAKLKMCVNGDICKITRMSKSAGEFPYYRVCR